jgi:lipoprotein-anchoring transpeptidase ErfK/SrfK
MDNDEVGDEFDLRDVPYVQYFKDGYALHAAYWHDGFGTPHSHGCVNLAPLDARFLFAWTEPPVPMAWHGAMSTHGTLVSIHP